METSPTERPVVAAFDFDGTLTSRDTLRIFLRKCVGSRRLAEAALRHLPSVVWGVGGGASRDRAKEQVIGRLLAGRHVDEVQAAALATAKQVESHLLRPDTVAWLRWHQAQGHRVIVVSASFDLYVVPVARGLGIDEVLATRLDVDGAGRLTGSLDGANVRGAEKARLLAATLDPGQEVHFAYGDSSGDHHMLGMAASPRWVRRRTLAPPEP